MRLRNGWEKCGVSASRQSGAADPSGRRDASEKRRTPRGDRDGIARVGHRYRQCRSGLPNRLTTLHRCGSAARRPRRTLGGRSAEGRFFPTTRDELLECAAILSAFRKGELERIEIPENALDILAQQIVAIAAAESWKEEDLFALTRSAYPYRNLPRKDFDEIVEMLSEGITTPRGRSGTLLHRDRINGRVKGRRGARLAAITSGGANSRERKLHRHR